jgi:hypothetical protein
LSAKPLAGALSVSRAFSPRRAEDEIELNEIKTQLILDRIESLPPGTPAEVRKQLWEDYAALSHQLVQISSVTPPPAFQTINAPAGTE